MWLGLIVGFILGIAIGGVGVGLLGAMTGAFVGWLVAARKSEVPPPADDAVARLERRIAALTARIERLEKTLDAGAASTPAPMDSASALSPGVEEAAGAVPPAAGDAPVASQPALAADPRPVPASVPASTVPLPPAASGPGLIERLLEGNLVAKLGVVILFFGMGFLLKFAYERGMFPSELRLLSVAMAGGVMFYLGRRLLDTRRTYALVLMGGAMGLAYLDVYFALKTFDMIGAPLAFALFACLGVATLGMAVRMDARGFATLGMIGAFLAPILASTSSSSHVLLFSYYLLLNLVILATSWFKAWRELNFVGFLFTFAIALVWGNATYRHEYFATVEPFLIAFFLLYLAIPILFAQRQPPQLKGLVDGTLVFGMPLSAAMLQAALTRGMGEHVLAWSALAASLVYAVLARMLWKREGMRLLAEAHLALAVVFGSVAPYFAFRGYPTFAFWTLEGAAIFWMGCRQMRVLPRAFGLALQLLAAGYFCRVTSDTAYADPWWNDRVAGCALIAMAALFTAWCAHRYREVVSRIEHSWQGVLMSWALAWLFAGFCLGAWAQWDATSARLSAVLSFAAVVVLVLEWLGTVVEWPAPRRAQWLLTVVMLGVATLEAVNGLHPLGEARPAAWGLAYAAAGWVLWRQSRGPAATTLGAGPQHALLCLLAVWLLAFELVWRADVPGYAVSWRLAGAAVAMAFGMIIVVAGTRAKWWPFTAHAHVFRDAVAVPLIGLSLAWTLFANAVSNGDARPFSYLPLLNPLDLAQLALLGAAALALVRLLERDEGARTLQILLALAAFWWINAVVLRTVHQWEHVPFRWDALLASTTAQAALSLLWTATALCMMFIAGRLRSRALWTVGACLLGVVVLKLFVNDLGNTGTVARIVSFLGVGALLLVIGYVAPVPPRTARANESGSGGGEISGRNGSPAASPDP